MKIVASTPDEYVARLNDSKKEAIQKLRKTIVNNLPIGFEETMNYNMIGYVVPHTLYPKGYHTNPDYPLPFINIAAQKNHIALYHMGLYNDPELKKWFTNSYNETSKKKLDMGKSCIRFKNSEDIPFPLIAELVSKINTDQWISIYESKIKNK